MISERESLQNAAENWKREAERVTAVAVKRQAEIERLRAVLKEAPEPIPALCGSFDPAEGLAWRYLDWYQKSRTALGVAE